MAARGRRQLEVAICDDQREDRKKITEAIAEYIKISSCEVHVREFESGEALLADDPSKFALFFLDVYMGGQTGIEVAAELRKSGCKGEIVFCSTSRESAADSYDVGALYYLVKPYEKEKLFGVLDRFFSACQAVRSITVKVGRSEERILVHDIIYIESNNKTCIIHTTAGDVETSTTLSQLGELLQAPEFARPIRYALVSMRSVVAVPTDVMRLSNGVEIAISRGKRKEMKDVFAEYRWMEAKARHTDNPV